MRVLITGGAGFIGSHLAARFAAQGHEVRVLDNLRSGRRENLDGIDCEFIEGSILDRPLLRDVCEGVERVFHLAAMISVAESMEKPLECTEINTAGTITLLEEAAAAGASRLVFSSSAAVYGDDPEIPKREDMRPAPKSPYAITKLDGEYYCSLFHREGRIAAAALRYFNVFGPRQDPASQYAAAVPIFISRALRGEPLTIFGDGKQTRDFIYVADIAAANDFLSTRPKLGGVYNAAYGKRMTIGELAQKIISQLGSSSSVEHGEPRPGDIRHSQASVEKLAAAGFSPDSDFEAGLRETIGHFQQEG